MKHTLFLMAMLGAGVCSQGAYADEWVKPVPQATEMQYEDTLYLWNVGAKGFFSDKGGAYGTQAVLADEGIKLYLQKYIDPVLTQPDSVWDGKTLVIYNYSTKHQKWCNLYINNASQMYVDRANQPNWFWQIEDRGNNVYRLFGADKNPSLNQIVWPDTYMGYDLTNPESIVLSPMLDIVNGSNVANYCVDWIFVSPEEYENVQDKLVTYNLAMELKARLEEGLAAGADVSGPQSVYDNTNSTDEELLQAIHDVNEAIRVVVENSASVDKPLDMAAKGYLKNPTFDNDRNGWLSTTGAQNQGLKGGQSDGTNFIGNVWENWNSKPFTGKMYQLIPNAPRGIYSFTLGARSDSGNGTYVYCANDSVELIGQTPQTKTVYANFEGDTLEVGMKKYVNVGKWMLMDNAVLTYYGNSRDSYIFWINSIMDSAPDFEDSYKQNKAYVEYQDVISSIQALQTKEEILASASVFKEALAVMQANVDAYKAYADQIEIAKRVVDEYGISSIEDYIMEVAEPNLYDGELSTQEILDAAEDLKNFVQEQSIESIEVGRECSSVIYNNDYFGGFEGWIVDDTKGIPGITQTESYSCAGAWNMNFNVYQDVQNLPEGVYRLEVPAFYRTEGNTNAWNNRETAEIKSYIYLNEQSMPIANVMNEAIASNDNGAGGNIYDKYYQTPDGTFVPNETVGASVAFQNGLYKNALYGIVKDGNLRVGINCNGSKSDRWTVWGGFKLFYEGYDEEQLTIFLNPLIEEAKDTVANCRFTKSFKDLLTQKYVAASNAISTGADGKVLFDCYLGFREMIDSAKYIIDLYDEFNKNTASLLTAIDETTGSAPEDVLSKASAIYAEAIDGYEYESFTPEQIDSITVEIKSVITQLRIPHTEASDDSPLDMTVAIINPGYDNDDNEGWSGTAAVHQTYANAQFYAKNFDTYQVIYGLPNGTYKVELDGFYRSGEAKASYEKYLIDEDSVIIHAFIYAESGGQTYSVPFMSIFKGINDGALNGGKSEVMLETGKYIPNTMQTTSIYMSAGHYRDNTLICQVADGTLKIGIKKEVLLSGDWTMFDNWRLTYYGDSSSQETDGDASGIVSPESKELMSTKYYSIGGVESSVPVKGINIVKSIYSDGTVEVHKILVK